LTFIITVLIYSDKKEPIRFLPGGMQNANRFHDEF
jgi:hypothetical protein